jgi:hypothetical protein
LFAGGVVVPFAVAFDDFEQAVGGRVALALGIEGEGEIEARLIVGGIVGERLF